MLKKGLLVVALLSFSLSVGCSSRAPKAQLKNNPSLKKVAVVSLAVSDWGGTVSSSSVGRDSVGNLVQNATGTMIASTEKELAKHWQVRKVDTFITDANYRKAAEQLRVSLYTPVINGKEMPLFGAGFKKGDITPDKAKTLCAALGVDAVVLVFSEWTVKTGGVVPLTKAVSKNIVSFWDSEGQKIFFRRIDVQGKKTLGAMGIKAVNQETIGEWTGGYEEALQKMLAVL
ncbi:MAG: hypothetical protein IH614_00145 [Desulfuromonadales bacterium]|nr:hypothetical protein [Desulfuromonadales bacterium]